MNFHLLPSHGKIVRAAIGLVGEERWYVARSLSRQEARAEFHLLLQGFRVFLPWMTKTVRHARKLRTIKSPLFPTYMFVALDPARDPWRSVNGTFGVASLIMAGEAPLAGAARRRRRAARLHQ